MAIIHRTTMKPTKLELLTEWLPRQPWYRGGTREPELVRVGGFRLDDPAGEVGIEFMAVADSGGGEGGGEVVTYHVPMTYRAGPVEGADDALIGTSEHGVLGLRWIYDGTRDPVLVGQLLALLAGRAVPQMQSVNDTPDPTVKAHLANPNPVITARYKEQEGQDEQDEQEGVTDAARGTSVRLRTGEGREITIRINRVLRPGEEPGAAGYVEADWMAPDGTSARGWYVTVPA